MHIFRNLPKIAVYSVPCHGTLFPLMLLRAVLLLALLGILPAEEPVTRIACGSCYKPKGDRGIWPVIASTKPELFLFMGDNIYADTEDMAVMRRDYAELMERPDFVAFRKAVPILPTWDDHDYGLNDAGAEYPKRRESRQVFLDVFQFPADHPARATPGVYHAFHAGPPGKRLQVILLDTRYFRSALKRPRVNGRLTYVPNEDPEATMLGEAQWNWLRSELRKPAELRIIVSSIQVITTEHRFEKWANLPRERQRFFDLLRTTKARNVILLSGDRHLAEFARISSGESGLPEDLLELTTSGLTHAGAPNDTNRHRIGERYPGINFGTLAIDWSAKHPAVTLAIRDHDARIIQEETVRFGN